MGLSVASKATLQHLKDTHGSTSAPYSRQQSAPLVFRSGTHKHHKSHQQLDFGRASGGALGGLDEAAGSEYVNVAAKTLDMDEIDKETLHLLVFLFMQFLSTPDQAMLPPPPADDSKHASKVLHASTRCFHSLYSLIGYNEAERRFQVMPHKLRYNFFLKKVCFN